MNRLLASRFRRQNETHLSAGNSNLKVLISLVFMAFLLNYVESMVIPSIPVLQMDFKSTTATSSWLISAFLISGAVAAPLFGRLGDNYGKKRMLVVALLIYTAGVGVAGFSTSMGELIIARALQGVGFGGIPIALAIIVDISPPDKVGTAQGIMSGMFATGGVAGLVAGSYLITYMGWQWAFHTALIVSIALLVAVVINVTRDSEREKEKIDFLGAALLASSITLILLYITGGVSYGWTSLFNVGLFAGGIVLAVLFLLQEMNSKQPLIHLGLMSQRNIMVSNLVGILASVLMQLMFLSFVYFADDPAPFGNGFNNIQTGLVLAPGAISMAIVGPMMGRIIRRTGPKPIIMSGTILLATGLGIFLTARTSELWLILSGMAIFTGIVSIFVSTVNMIAMGMPPERRAIGMGMNMMLRSIGGSIGPAVAASVMTVDSGSVAVSATANVAATTVQSFPTAPAFNILMLVGLILAGAMVLVNLATRNYTIAKKREPE